ncbi:hypothetical protein FA15DRAFT_405594 [Coprinopsis marcescibilis]|uniref:Uncharacterized protein n=1 Tax=Coprinopsis marcescibilis TaxID=230819 RepID=A0A5C3KW69_COPMA|nr:hypothetical protein FA15DRAFT_405594 [Coprinopsis marcescibilis]
MVLFKVFTAFVSRRPTMIRPKFQRPCLPVRLRPCNDCFRHLLSPIHTSSSSYPHTYHRIGDHCQQIYAVSATGVNQPPRSDGSLALSNLRRPPTNSYLGHIPTPMTQIHLRQIHFTGCSDKVFTGNCLHRSHQGSKASRQPPDNRVQSQLPATTENNSIHVYT